MEHLAPALHTFLNEKHPPNDDDRNRHATFYLAWAADYPATAAAEADNVAAAWRWVQSGHQVDVPAHWDPTWLARLERGHPPVVLAPTVSGQVLVGRATELAHLRTALRPVGKEKRNGGLVVISAPAGMGKTLLVDRLQQETAGVVWFYCPCDETNRQSLYPIRHGLRRYFGQTSGPTSNDDLAAFHARMDDLIQATGDESLRGELEEARSFLAALVDIVLPDSLYARVQREQRRQHFYAAIRALARAESLLQPLIIHLEDAHWLDSESRELLATLLRNVAAYPFAVVATVRPSRFDPPALADAPLHTVALQPLDSAGVAELAAAHLHGEPGRGLVELLLLRAGGNPFHTEQLLIYLRSNGLVAGGELVTAGASGPDIPLPLDIHNVLVARLGRLQGDARSLLAHASVLGQEFSVDELQSVVGGENSVRGALEEESSREIVRPVGSGRYAFNHALFHAATYDSQFDAQKQAYHRKAAQAIASQSGSEQPDFARIAHHWDKAEDQQRAAVGYLAAGDQAQENYFLREAHGYYSRGLALTNDNHQRLDFYLGRERVNHWLGNREEQREDLYRLTELTVGSEDSAQLADISLRRATFALAVADYSLAVQHAQGAAKLAASIYDQALEAQAYHRWGRALWQQGRGESAQPLLRRALRLADSAKRIDVQAVCLYDLAMLAYYADQYDAARTQIAKASALFEAGHDKHNLVRCNNLLGTIAAVEGDIERAIGYYNASLGMCRAVDWPWGEIYCSARLGDCHFDLGDYEACRSLHQLALMLARNVKDRMAEVVSLDTIGLSYQFQGAFEQARQYFNEALALHDTIDYPRGRAFVETHLGQLLADMEETEQAGIHLYNALAQRSSSGSKAAAVDTEAALAWMDMARGDTEFAAERARDVTAWLDENGIAGVELPLLVYWQCYAIFRMIGMADDAARTLAAGYKLLQSRAERIKDPGLRHGFLHNIAHHRHIVAMWEML